MVRKIVLSLIMLAMALIILNSCTSSQLIDPSRRKPVSPDKMIVVFRSDIDEENNYEIYALRADKKPMDAEGSLVKRLTNTPSPAAEVFPTIARDADMVVYCSSVNDLGGNPFFPDFDLFKVQISTLQSISITDTGREREYAPSISGDGKTLTFMVDSFGRQAGDLYIMNMDKPTERKLIQENLSRRAFPHVSADGKFVIYSAPAGKTKKMDVFIVNLDTREVMNITRTPDQEEVYPDFSDDRKIIVYELQDNEEKAAPEPSPSGQATEEKKEKEETKESTPPGNQPDSGTANPGNSGSPTGSGNDGGIWLAGAGEGGKTESPPSEKGSTSTQPQGETQKPEPEKKPEPPKTPPANKNNELENDWEIWLMNVQNGKKQKITDNKFQDMFPIISGDGTWVVYTSARQDYNDDNQNEFEVYMMDLLTMKEDQISTMPFHHDTIEISW